MRNVVLTRVDERLIHGQVMTSWLKLCNANVILIIDAGSASNAFLKRILFAAAPKDVARRLQHGKAKASDLDSVTVGIGVGVIQRPGRQALGQDRVRLAQPDGAARRLRHAAHAADMVKMTVRQQDSADGQAIALRCLQHALWRIAGIDDGADAVVIRSEIAIGLVAAQHQGIDLHGLLLFSHRANA